MGEYKRLMTARLGLKSQKESDFQELFSEFLDILQAYELDFHHAFRRLGNFKLSELETEDGRKDVAGRFFQHDAAPRQEAESRERIGKWLEKWVTRVKEDWGEDTDAERKIEMDKVNPNVRSLSYLFHS
jgi:uncharacterized protein YdiU (UPF0061 family)